MQLQTTKQTPYLIAAVVVVLMGFFASAPRWVPGVPTLERLEWMTYDWRVRTAVHFPPPVATNLGFVFINDASIDAVSSGDLGFQHGLYWPRHVYGRLVRELTAQGAKVVAFDVLFGELRPDHAEVREPGRPPVGSDEFFAGQNQTNGHVVLAASRMVLPPPLLRASAWMLGHIDADSDEGILRRAKPFADYRDWHELIRNFARNNGVDLSKAIIEPQRIILTRSDGKPQRLQLDARGRFNLFNLAEKLDPQAADIYEPPFVMRRIWHTGIVMAARELKLDLKQPEIDPEAGVIVLRGTGGVTRRIPLNAEGFFYVDWSLPPNHPLLVQEGIHGLIEQDNDRRSGDPQRIAKLKDRFRDKLVVVGSMATGNDLSDRGGTPLEKATYLISKHWNVANSILTGRFVHRSPLGWNLGIIFLLGALATLITSRLPVPWGTVLVLVLAALYAAVAHYCYIQHRLWLPLVLPALGAVLLTHAALVSYQVIFEEREKRRVKSVFSKLVSPNVVTELLSTEKLNFGGARREITVLFADVRGFTKLTDLNQENTEKFVREHHLTGDAAEAYFNEQAQETLNTVNIYLSTIADQIKKHDGTLDKYIGDCVMAFWGAPTANEKHAVSCVRAAYDAQRAMHYLNEKRDQENKRREAENPARLAAGLPPLPMNQLLALGTGINSGVSIVGLMGSDSHILNYTVFGREVNVASRLEGVSGRGRIIIGGATYDSILKHDPALAATCAELPAVLVKGIKDAVRIYEVPWKPAEPATSTALPAEPAKAEPAADAPKAESSASTSPASES